MNISFHSVVVFVKDIEKSKKFYSDIMDQNIEFDFGKNIIFKNGLSVWEISSDHVITRSGKHHDTETTKAYELYFESDDLGKIQEKIAHQNIDFLHDLMEEPWGQRTLRFYDPDNNLVEIGETMECFVTRMASEGMNTQEIAEKTTIPVEIIKKILG